MIVVFARDEDWGEGVLHLLPGTEAVRVDSVADLEKRAAAAACCVVLVPELSDDSLLEPICHLIGRLPWLGWILLSRCTPRNVRCSEKLRALVRIEWIEEAGPMLEPWVMALVDADPLTWMSRAVEGWCELPRELREAMVRACWLPRPPLTVAGLCGLVGLKETRFRYLWKMAVQPGCGTPREFVEWLVVAWSWRMRHRKSSWSGVARDLRVQESTLRALWFRRTGRRPSEVSVEGSDAVRRGVAEWWARARSG